MAWRGVVWYGVKGGGWRERGRAERGGRKVKGERKEEKVQRRGGRMGVFLLSSFFMMIV